MMDKFVIVFMDVKHGNPADDENMVSSPVVIRKMCRELMEQHDTVDKPNVIATIRRTAKAEGIVLGDGYPPALNGMTWGDWAEVGRHRKNPNMRMFVAKVVDDEITEIDRKFGAKSS